MKKILLIVGLIAQVGAFAQDSLNIKLLYHWKADNMPVSNAHANGYNEIWGFVQAGKEYAVIGSTKGTHIFDVTNPSTASLSAFVNGNAQGTQIVHRDFHDYQGYLYAVCDEGNSTLQISDLSYLPDSVHLVYNSDSLFKRSHNIFIDSATAKMYVCGGENHLNVYSLADPEKPVLLVNCSTQVSFWEPAIGYLHDIYVRNDTAYCNAGNNGLFIVDFSNTQNPVLLGSLTQYPYKGYNHSGWLSNNGKTYALADENHGYKIKLLDVQDPSDISFVDTIGSDVDSLSIPHNLIFKGDYLFVSYYHDGTYIWNVADPANPFLVGFYDTSTQAHSTNYKGNWGVYPFLPSGHLLASDMQNGLYVFDVSQAVANGIEDPKEKNQVVLFPNPTAGQFSISIPNPRAYANYSICDPSGRVVSNGTIHNSVTSIHLPATLANGLYILNLMGETTQNSLKISLIR